MGLWVELGIFGLALAFGLWQLHDVKKAREETRRQKAREQARQLEDQARQGGAGGPADPPT
jgi:Flp pilus assembly protein TadB